MGPPIIYPRRRRRQRRTDGSIRSVTAAPKLLWKKVRMGEYYPGVRGPVGACFCLVVSLEIIGLCQTGHYLNVILRWPPPLRSTETQVVTGLETFTHPL